MIEQAFRFCRVFCLQILVLKMYHILEEVYSVYLSVNIGPTIGLLCLTLTSKYYLIIINYFKFV